MSTLYELKNDYKRLLEIVEEGLIDEETLSATLEGIDFEIEDKADSYAKIIKYLEGQTTMIKTEANRLNDKCSMIDKNISTLKKNLQDAMTETGKTKFKTTLFSFGIQKNPPSLIVTGDVPGEYMIQKDPEPNKSAIKEALKNGINLEFAHLEQGESLRIR